MSPWQRVGLNVAMAIECQNVGMRHRRGKQWLGPDVATAIKHWNSEFIIAMATGRVRCCDGDRTRMHHRRGKQRLRSDVAMVIKRQNVGMRHHRGNGLGQMLRRQSNVGMSECAIAMATGRVKRCNSNQMSERRNAPSPWQWLGPDVATVIKCWNIRIRHRCGKQRLGPDVAMVIVNGSRRSYQWTLDELIQCKVMTKE